jgi:beta-aspartyl-peptidase (threonine type)
MFIRTAAAFNTAAQVRLLHTPLTEAADSTLAEIAAIGGDGGLIVLDVNGNYAMRFNTGAMFRGTIGEDGVAQVGIFSGPEIPVRNTGGIG